MSNAYENLSKNEKKKLMENYVAIEKQGIFAKQYTLWKRLNFDKGGKDIARWKGDSTGLLWAVEKGFGGPPPNRLNPVDAQAQEILASGAPASTTAVSRGNASQGGRRRTPGKKSKKTGKTFDDL